MFNSKHQKIMKLRGLYIVICLFVLAMVSCGDKENEEKEYEPKSFELELNIDGYAIDTVIPIKEFISAIETITEDADWLDVAINDAASDSAKMSYQLRIACTRNTTTSVRTTDLTVTCTNKDALKITINQGILDNFDDLHDNVTDKPALAPLR